MASPLKSLAFVWQSFEKLLFEPANVVVLATIIGLIVGPLLAIWLRRLIAAEAENGGEHRSVKRSALVVLITTATFAALTASMLLGHCQEITEVRPDYWTWVLRVAYHLCLLALLIVATGIDLKCFVIPDSITFSGLAVGVGAAVLVGDLQMQHIWVDWSQEVPHFQGAWTPAWIERHPHWHGLACSAAGTVVGAGIAWLVRIISSRMLGQEALGFGDVTLMAMIGSFIGWQPVLFVFVLAPFCGLLAALGAKLLLNRPYLPYGPFLAAATMVVLTTWRWIWPPVQLIFSDPFSLAVLAGVSVGALALLLLLLRLYRMIPGKRRDA